MTQLLKEFRAGQALSAKFSGIEESKLTEFQELLTSICKLQDLQKILPKEMKKLYSKAARVEAESIRNTALLEIENGNASYEDPEVEITPATSRTTTTPTTTTPALSELQRKRQRVINNGHTDLVEFLKTKNDFEFQNDELKVRAIEAENRRLELEPQKQKQEAELINKQRTKDIMFKILEKNL